MILTCNVRLHLSIIGYCSLLSLLSFIKKNELPFCSQALYECTLSAFAINFQVGLIFGSAFSLDVLFLWELFCFFPWEIIKSSTHSSGFRVLIVSCEIYPIVWQAWEGVFGCVYINKAKIGTTNRKWYEVDVLFVFQHIYFSLG